MPPRGRSRTPRNTGRVYVRTRPPTSASRTRAITTIANNRYVKQYVKKQLDKAIENKTINEKEYDHSCIEKQLLGGTGHFYYSLASLYNMTQGPGEFQRVGCSITNKKTIIRFLIYPQIMQAPTSASSVLFNQFTYTLYTSVLGEYIISYTLPDGVIDELPFCKNEVKPDGTVEPSRILTRAIVK